jgi:hypothetical protein
MVPRRGSEFTDIYQEVRYGFLPESSAVVLPLDFSRGFCKAVVGYTDVLCVVFKAILVFIVRKSRVLWRTSTIRVAGPMGSVNSD